MGDRDSTETSTGKDASRLIDSRPLSAPERAHRAEKELTDEQIAAVIGGASSSKRSHQPI